MPRRKLSRDLVEQLCLVRHVDVKMDVVEHQQVAEWIHWAGADPLLSSSAGKLAYCADDVSSSSSPSLAL